MQIVIDWINVEDKLPKDQEKVIIVSGNKIEYVKFQKGISKAEREQMKRGEIENPIVKGWGPVSGHVEYKRSDSYRAADEDGNNKKPYCWYVSSAGANINGQDVTWWAYEPNLPQDDICEGTKEEININQTFRPTPVKLSGNDIICNCFNESDGKENINGNHDVKLPEEKAGAGKPEKPAQEARRNQGTV